MDHVCPVCGFTELESAPRSPHTGGGSFEICPSCGFQFGVIDDDKGFTYEEWRALWRMQGMPWSSSRPRPEHWNPKKQLDNLK
jgi:hypothetical protein